MPLVDLVAGSVGGCVSLFVTYPLYALVVKRQLIQKSVDQQQQQRQEEQRDQGGEGEDDGACSAAERHRKVDALMYLTGLSRREMFAGLKAALIAVTVQSGM